jgi:uncharacterized membrane protein YciS (DUF1049 family)
MHSSQVSIIVILHYFLLLIISLFFLSAHSTFQFSPLLSLSLSLSLHLIRLLLCVSFYGLIRYKFCERKIKTNEGEKSRREGNKKSENKHPISISANSSRLATLFSISCSLTHSPAQSNDKFLFNLRNLPINCNAFFYKFI